MFIQSGAKPGASLAARRLLAILPVLLTTTAAFAQPPATPAQPGYKSVFDGYQPYTNEKLVAWKEANDKLAQARGRRSHAPEAEQAAPATAPAVDPSGHSVHPGHTGLAKP